MVLSGFWAVLAYCPSFMEQVYGNCKILIIKLLGYR